MKRRNHEEVYTSSARSSPRGKRLLSWLLSIVMVFSLLPVSALAEDDAPAAEPTEEVSLPAEETPEPEPAPETAAPGSHSLLSAQKQTSVAALGRVLLDLADRYPGIVLTVNGTAVRSMCLNVRVMMGEDTTTSTLDLEVG